MTPVTTSKPSRFSLALLDNRYPALHGLRVLAILSIIAVHENIGLTPQIERVKWSFWFGMDLFFVLSGFLIGGILFGSRRMGTLDTFKRFYARRLSRTLPTYYATLPVVIMCYIFHRGAVQIDGASFLRELFFLTNYPSQSPTYLMPWSWSLSLEEQFYLVVPFLILLIKGLPPGFGAGVLLMLFVAPIAIRYQGFTQPHVFFVDIYTPTHMRFDTLIAGISLAFWHHYYGDTVKKLMGRPLVPWSLLACGIGLLGVLSTYRLYVWDPGNQYSLIYKSMAFGTLTSMAHVALILWAVYGRDPLQRLLGANIFRQTATLGYSVYLIHIPAMHLFGLIPIGLTGWALWSVNVAGVVVVSLAYGYVMHLLIEKPVLALRERLTLSESPVLRDALPADTVVVRTDGQRSGSGDRGRG